jgi:hypothetical protein
MSFAFALLAHQIDIYLVCQKKKEEATAISNKLLVFCQEDEVGFACKDELRSSLAFYVNLI